MNAKKQASRESRAPATKPQGGGKGKEKPCGTSALCFDCIVVKNLSTALFVFVRSFATSFKLSLAAALMTSSTFAAANRLSHPKNCFFFLPWCKKKKGRKRRRRDRRGRKEEGTRRSGGSSWSVEDNPKKDYPPRFEAAPTDPRRISRLNYQTPRGKKGRRSKQTRPGRQEEKGKRKEEKHHQNNILASVAYHTDAS